jgi:hypothetical protein
MAKAPGTRWSRAPCSRGCLVGAVLVAGQALGGDRPVGDGDVLAVEEVLACGVAGAVGGGVDVGEDGAGAGAGVEDRVNRDADQGVVTQLGDPN